MSHKDVETPDNSISPVSGTEAPLNAGPPQERKPRLKKLLPQTLGEFIAQAYARNGRKVSLSSALEKNLARSPSLSYQERSELLALSRGDTRLAVALELLLAIRKFSARPQLRNALRDFVGEALQMHPVFAGTPDLLDVMANRPGSLDPERGLKLLGASALSDLVHVGAARRLSPKAIADLRVNAIYALMFWVAETRDIPYEGVVTCLYRALWGPAGAKVKSEAERFRQLIGKPNLRTLGGVGAIFRAAVDEQVRRSDLACDLAVKEKDRAEQLSEAREQLIFENSRLGQQRDVLTAQLEDLQTQVVTERFHARDDYERLRGRLFQRLKQEVKLLEDGLHALRRTPPKVDVMDDHAERVLDGLKREIIELSKESGT